MEECLICLEELNVNVCTLSCKHKYHYECIEKYIKKTNNLSHLCCICQTRCEIINIENCKNNLNKYKFHKLFLCCNIL